MLFSDRLEASVNSSHANGDDMSLYGVHGCPDHTVYGATQIRTALFSYDFIGESNVTIVDDAEGFCEWPSSERMQFMWFMTGDSPIMLAA